MYNTICIITITTAPQATPLQDVRHQQQQAPPQQRTQHSHHHPHHSPSRPPTLQHVHQLLHISAIIALASKIHKGRCGSSSRLDLLATSLLLLLLLLSRRGLSGGCLRCCSLLLLCRLHLLSGSSSSRLHLCRRHSLRGLKLQLLRGCLLRLLGLREQGMHGTSAGSLVAAQSTLQKPDIPVVLQQAEAAAEALAAAQASLQHDPSMTPA